MSFNAAITVCEKAGAREAALSLLAATPLPGPVTLSAAIAACATPAAWKRGLALLASPFTNFKRGEERHTDECQVPRAPRVCEASEYFRKFTVRRTTPRSLTGPRDVVSLNAALAGCEKALAWPVAIALLAGWDAEGAADTVSTVFLH